MHQPIVIGEIIAGIVLGPSLLGLIPGFDDTLFPPDSIIHLQVVAYLGLNFYLFLVGLRLDILSLAKTARKYLVISLAGIVVPVILGIAASFTIYPYLKVSEPKEKPPLASFILYISVTFAITALPVLAHIITDSTLLKTMVGTISMSAAVVDDAFAWILLALVVPLLSANKMIYGVYIFLLIIAFAAILFLFVRPIYLRFISYIHQTDSSTLHHMIMGFSCAMIFIASWITELIGAHAIFGAFLVGLMIPPDNKVAIQLTERLEEIVLVLFLPLNYALSGFRTDLRLFSDPYTLLTFGVILGFSCVGKVAGCAFASKFTGLSWRESITIGMLMNTKGLLELIVLNIGYDLHVIGPDIFTAMVVVSLLTTFLTTPVINFVYPSFVRSYIGGAGKTDSERGTSSNNGEKRSFSFLIALSSIDDLTTIGVLLSLFRKKHLEGKVEVNCVRYKEVVEWTSNVLMATQTAAFLGSDEVYKMVHLVCQLLGINVKYHLAFGSYSNFKNSVVEVASAEFPEYIVFPLHDQVPHSKYMDIRDVLMSTTAVGVMYMDRGLTTHSFLPSRKARVFLPYIGGKSHREAIFFCINVGQRQPLDIDLFIFRPGHSTVHKPESVETVQSEGQGPTNLSSDDDLMKYVELYFTSPYGSRFNVLRIYDTPDYEKGVSTAFRTNEYDLLITGSCYKDKDKAIDDYGQFIIKNVDGVGVVLVNSEWRQDSPPPSECDTGDV
jgi:Kef-type K+ transport system membrane component KefB